MRILILSLLALIGSTLGAGAQEWHGALGPNESVTLAFFKDGTFRLVYEERWEITRTAIATGTYQRSPELLDLNVSTVEYEGADAASRHPEDGFTIETPRLGVLDDNPKVRFWPGGWVRLQVLEDMDMLQLQRQGGFQLTLRQGFAH